MDQLKKAGLRITPQRLAIMKYLDGNTTHPSVDKIYRELKPQFPSLSMATVYNTLQALTQAGIVQEINIEPGKKHFDPNPRPHSHFYCEKCKRVFDINLDVPELEVPLWIGDFRVDNYYINVKGKCPDCQAS